MAMALPFAAAGMAAFGQIVQGMQSSRNYGSEQQAAEANATYDRQMGNAAFMSAASRGAQGIRTGEEDVGRQAAEIGQSGSGVASSSSQDVLRQSETNERMDFLNTIYGGKLARSGYYNDASQQDYMAKIAGMNKQNSMYGGFLGAGTKALQSGTSYAMPWLLPTQPTPYQGMNGPLETAAL